MQEISIHDSQAVSETIRVFLTEKPVVMLELPCVYGLIAPCNLRGVSVLDETKLRLPGKTYGSIPGNFNRFVRLASDHVLPPLFKRPINPDSFVSSFFIRLRVAEESTSTPTIRNGSHQALFLSELPFQDFFEKLEISLREPTDTSLFPGMDYTGVLCTSANISGDSEGSITDYDRAITFARERGISLLLRGDGIVSNSGSYPIFSFEKNTLRVARSGPGIQELLRALPRGFELIE